MPLTHNFRCKKARLRRQDIYCWANTLGSHGTVEHNGTVKLVLNHLHGWIGQVVSWHINGLKRGNGTVGVTCEAVLEGFNVAKYCWLVTTFGWGLVDNGRNLVFRLNIAIHIVGKEKHIFFKVVAEIFGQGNCCEANKATLHGVFIHLAKEHGRCFEQVVIVERFI